MRALSLLLLVVSVVFSAVGCGKQITDYVTGGARRGPGGSTDLPSVSASKPVGMKISPGANVVSGSQVKSQFAITPTQRAIAGSQVKATLTFHQNRPN